MNANEKILDTFATRTRQMILHYRDLKEENRSLHATVGEREAEIRSLRIQLAQAQSDYNSLKMAKMLEITDGDMENARKRLSRLIRDVNKCITLLSEK